MKKIALAALFATLLPAAVQAGPADEAYIAARDKYAAEIKREAAADASQDRLDKLDGDARAALETQISKILGPLRFKGLGPKPTFSPGTLVPGYIESEEPDGLMFADKDWQTRLIVSPEPVFANWLAARAKEQEAPAAFRQGIAAAFKVNEFYTSTISSDAAFTSYVALPVTAPTGETAYAALGIFAQDMTTNAVPDSIVIGQIANGRVVVGTTTASVKIKQIPVCDKVWKGYEKKSAALQASAAKAGAKQREAKLAEAADVEAEGEKAYRACFAEEAPKLPFFATVTKRAEALLQTARGN